MTTKIDGLEFEIREGVIETPRRSVKTYTSPVTPGVGAQVYGERGEPFDIILKQYADASQIEIMKESVRSKIGRIVQLQADGVIYLLPGFGGYRFLVEAASIVSAEIIPLACGTRSTGSYTHAPAARVVSRWTMRAIR